MQNEFFDNVLVVIQRNEIKIERAAVPSKGGIQWLDEYCFRGVSARISLDILQHSRSTIVFVIKPDSSRRLMNYLIFQSSYSRVVHTEYCWTEISLWTST